MIIIIDIILNSAKAFKLHNGMTLKIIVQIDYAMSFIFYLHKIR